MFLRSSVSSNRYLIFDFFSRWFRWLRFDLFLVFTHNQMPTEGRWASRLLRRSRFWLPGAPVALNESPFAIDDNSIPGIGEFSFDNLHSWFVSHTFRMAFHIDTMQCGKTKHCSCVDSALLLTKYLLFVLPAQTHEERMIRFCSIFDSTEETHWRVRSEMILKINRVQIFHCNPSKDRPVPNKWLCLSLSLPLIFASLPSLFQIRH